ncbi:MAG: PilZ domain-containing protein [Actinomycetota bacterium]
MAETLSHQLVVPGTQLIFVPEGSTSGFPATAIEVETTSIRAHIEADEPAVDRRTHGSVVVIAKDGRSAVVAADVAPSRNLYEVLPTTSDPPERRAHPRVPVSNPVTVTVVGRMGAMEGRMVDLSLGGCQVLRHSRGGAMLNKRSKVAIRTSLNRRPVTYTGRVVKSLNAGSDQIFSVQFAEMDIGVHTLTERFIDDRLARVAAMSATTRPVAAKVETNGQVVNAMFDPLDDSFSTRLTTSARVVARFRLPSVAPTLVAAGMVMTNEHDRSIVRWNRTDPVTRVLIERAAADRRAVEAAKAG